MDKLSERIAVLETREEQTEAKLEAHDILIRKLDGQLSTIVVEVKQIRNALYVMAVAIMANVPQVAEVVKALLKLFNF